MSKGRVASDGRIQIGKISVKMGDTVVDLTVDQARELSALLKGLFGDDSTKIIHTRDYWYPNPWYVTVTSAGLWEYQGVQWDVNTSGNSASGPVSVNFCSTK